MLIYVLQWRPSWISDRHKKTKMLNVHWVVLYKLSVFSSNMKWKMAATTGLSLTLDLMGNMFHNASSNRKFIEDLPMIIPGQFGFNFRIGFKEEAF
jgi:hypothetical protein